MSVSGFDYITSCVSIITYNARQVLGKREKTSIILKPAISTAGMSTQPPITSIFFSKQHIKSP